MENSYSLPASGMKIKGLMLSIT